MRSGKPGKPTDLDSLHRQEMAEADRHIEEEMEAERKRAEEMAEQRKARAEDYSRNYR